MHRAAACALCNLFAATEAVGDDESFGGRLADGGEEFEFADLHGDFVLLFFKAEGAGHAAAAFCRGFEVDADAAQHGFFRGHLH